jgi:hypothetical protein
VDKCVDKDNKDKEVSMWIIDYTHPDGGYQVGKPKKPLLGKMEWEDGTPFNPPENPLLEKWNKLYPPTKKPEYSQVCDGYSCMWCGRCPHGEYWKVPEEDVDEYNEWLWKKEQYIQEHGGMDNVFIPMQMSVEEWENQ